MNQKEFSQNGQFGVSDKWNEVEKKPRNKGGK